MNRKKDKDGEKNGRKCGKTDRQKTEKRRRDK